MGDVIITKLTDYIRFFLESDSGQLVREKRVFYSQFSEEPGCILEIQQTLLPRQIKCAFYPSNTIMRRNFS
jgi:hypothetical protein